LKYQYSRFLSSVPAEKQAFRALLAKSVSDPEILHTLLPVCDFSLAARVAQVILLVSTLYFRGEASILDLFLQKSELF
jgi:hypothetical protein